MSSFRAFLRHGVRDSPIVFIAALLVLVFSTNHGYEAFFKERALLADQLDGEFNDLKETYASKQVRSAQLVQWSDAARQIESGSMLELAHLLPVQFDHREADEAIPGLFAAASLQVSARSPVHLGAAQEFFTPQYVDITAVGEYSSVVQLMRLMAEHRPITTVHTFRIVRRGETGVTVDMRIGMYRRPTGEETEALEAAERRKRKSSDAR